MLVETPRINIDILDHFNMTALHHATAKNLGNIASILLAHPRCDVDAKYNEKDTALNMANFLGFEDLAQVLVDSGADVSVLPEEDREKYMDAAGNTMDAASLSAKSRGILASAHNTEL
jgi:ankyrin repeat protein